VAALKVIPAADLDPQRDGHGGLGRNSHRLTQTQQAASLVIHCCRIIPFQISNAIYLIFGLLHFQTIWNILQAMLLSTAAEIIEKLGGINTVGTLTNSGYRAVWNWKASNKFPARTFVVIDYELRKQGHIAPTSLWGMAETGRTVTSNHA
jgi:hypothetical protein